MVENKEKNLVEFGLENCYWAKATVGLDGKISYETPKRYPGAVSLSLDTNGDLMEFEADNIVYYSSPNNKGYTGKFVAAKMPDEFSVDILGEIVDKDDQVQTEVSSAQTSPFALLFQFEGDKNATRHVLYNCSANRTSFGSATGKESPNTTELNFNATPRPFDKAVKTKTKETTTPTVYDNWFEKVYEKTAGA